MSYFPASKVTRKSNGQRIKLPFSPCRDTGKFYYGKVIQITGDDLRIKWENKTPPGAAEFMPFSSVLPA